MSNEGTIRMREWLAGVRARVRRLRVAGIARWFPAAGLAATLVATLVVARTAAPKAAAWLTERTWSEAAYAQIVQGRVADDPQCGVRQFLTYVVLVVMVTVAALAYAGLRRLAVMLTRRRRRLQVLPYALDVLAFAGALVGARQAGRFPGRLALDVIVGAGLVILAHVARGAPPVRAPDARVRAALVLVPAALATGWAAWFLFSPDFGASLLAPIVALIALAAWRAGSVSPADEDVLARDAIACVPLLLLPFLGLLRNPSPRWFLGAVILATFARFTIALVPVRRIPEWLASVAGPTIVAAIFLLPLRFRELGQASHKDHEGQHLGWIASAMHGKVLFADAGFTYGPVREYGLAILAWVMGGVRLDHVRLAHVALNLAGVACLFWCGWRAAHRRVALFVFWGWLVLVQTPAWFFLNYQEEICFGWADDARAGVALVAIFAALAALERTRGERLHPRSRALWIIAATGALGVASFLYSQDCGASALAAVAITFVADAAFHANGASLRARASRAAFTTGAYVAGVVLGFAAFFAPYVARGRAHALLETFRYERVLASGMSGATVTPFEAKDFLRASTFFAPLGDDAWKLDFFLPLFFPLVAIVAIVATLLWARWSSRTSLLTALALFSIALCRYGLMRADVWHVAAASVGAWLLFVALLADATRNRLHLGFGRARVAWPLAAIFFTVVTAILVRHMKPRQGLGARFARITAGWESPSAGDPYKNDDLPRAGDENVDQKTRDLVKYVRENTRPDEKIWVVYQYLTGGEIYFLSDRDDATPFDLWCEVVSRHDADRIMTALKETPPTLIVGHGFDYTPDLVAYVEAHWKVVTTVQGIKIRRFQPASF